MIKTLMPSIKIDIAELEQPIKKGYIRFEIGKDITFSTNGLTAYCFRQWESIVYDAMIVTASIECGDRICKRSAYQWARSIHVRIPVYNIEKWKSPSIYNALIDAIQFLTGDYWTLEFVKNANEKNKFSETYLPLNVNTSHILAYSNGLDSLMVAGLLDGLKDKLLRIRVSKGDNNVKNGYFTSVPYNIRYPKIKLETSARNRGFRFAMISSIAAYLTQAKNIVIPESWQGSIGPAILTVGHAYPDYRNHPKFTNLMEKLVNLLFETKIKFIYPQLWKTKSETLQDYIKLFSGVQWQTTTSCWKDSRWSSVNGKYRQCGICAACMLRRVSIYNAGLSEPKETYVCENLNADTIQNSVASDYTQVTKRFLEYAIGGVMFMDNLAHLTDDNYNIEIANESYHLADSLSISTEEAKDKLYMMIKKHSLEWNNFLSSLNSESFIKQWIGYKK